MYILEYFHYSTCKNRNLEAAIPVARPSLSSTSLAVFTFLNTNVGVVTVGMSGWSHILDCFGFCTCKNYIAKIVVLVARAFLSNTSLAIFAFLIANKETAV